MWLAKVAGEIEKPNGLIALPLFRLPELYRKLKLTDLPGLNFRMERQLNFRKINSAADFFNSSLSDLSLWFGHPGRLWYYRLRGYEVDEIKTNTKSVGHSHVLSPEFRNRVSARRVLAKMAEKCAKRLRAKNLWSSGLGLSITFLEGGYYSRHLKTNLVCDSKSVRQAAMKLYDECTINKIPLKVSVTLLDLKQMHYQPISLFKDLEKSRQISQTLDKINDRYGDQTIYSAAEFDTLEAAPNRIPFGNPERLNF
jgi:DNA polymerase-4